MNLKTLDIVDKVVRLGLLLFLILSGTSISAGIYFSLYPLDVAPTSPFLDPSFLGLFVVGALCCGVVLCGLHMKKTKHKRRRRRG